MGVTTGQTQRTRKVRPGRCHRADVGISAYAGARGSRRHVSQRVRTFQAQYVVVAYRGERRRFVRVGGCRVSCRSKIVVVGSKSHLRRTAKKHPVTRKTAQKFRESAVWRMENELYAFVAREFAFAYAKQFPLSAPPPPPPSWLNGSTVDGYSKSVGDSGGGMPPPSFRYEKIYPKPSSQQRKKKKYADHG